jgi:hypothetical protein
MRTWFIILSLGCCGLMGLSAEEARVPGGRELFEKHFAAVGGRKAAEAISTVTVAGKVEEGGQHRDFTLQTKYPGMILLTLREPSGKVSRQGREAGGQCWSQTSAGIRDLEPRLATELACLSMAFNLKGQVFAADKLADAICETGVSQGRKVFSTGKKNAPRRVMMRVWFDAETGKIAGFGQARYEDYRKVEGIEVPHRVRQGAKSVYRVQTVRFGEEISDKIFSRPGGDGSVLGELAQSRAGSGVAETLLSSSGKLEIVRRPAPAKFNRTISRLPKFDHDSGDHGQVDLRSGDLRKLDVHTSAYELLHADFDARTKWPKDLPKGFEPAWIMELCKDPGLGIRELHAKGITGKGVGIGIIDMPLLTEHREYADRLRSYEEICSTPGASAQMHGAGVASIALGKTCGVAPEADLYYIAVRNTSTDAKGKWDLDYGPVGKAIGRLLDINKTLPAERRTRVISISMGWGEGSKGYAEVTAAVERARREDVFVISTALRHTHGLRFDGLGRESTEDPNSFESYGPGFWWATSFWSGEMRFQPGTRLCFPMDARTTASPTGADEYVHYNTGGWSWTVPWIAGLYAMACQVRPDVTPELFWSEGFRTGKTVEILHAGETISFGTIVDPQALMHALTAKTNPAEVSVSRR